jgi:hypothetical protein
MSESMNWRVPRLVSEPRFQRVPNEESESYEWESTNI